MTTQEQNIYPDLSNLTINKLSHGDMILQGCCTSCACCGHELTDAISVQRGMGGVCSKRGYSEDPTDGDEIEAFIALAEFPELAKFLTEHYKPLGIRGLVNGLVRTASLNRPHGTGHKLGNEKVFSACCDSIEALGHKKMANLLRETLVVAWINAIEDEPGMFFLRTMKRVTPDWWMDEIKRNLTNSMWDEEKKMHRVIFAHYTNEGCIRYALSNVMGSSGNRLLNKTVAWNLLIRGFEGGIVKVDGKILKLEKKSV